MLGRVLRSPLTVRLPLRATFAQVKFEEIEDELKQYMHGRKFSERRDSISRDILRERKKHQEKFSSVEVDVPLVRSLRQVSLGSKKQLAGVYEKIANQHETHGGVDMQTNMGAGGFSVHVASAAKDWPLFKHLLPEIVFAGHSNSGKSTLVNGLSGVLPRKGPASTSERAGWTDQICFYQLGKKPPVMTLVDFPGYGHAIATVEDRREWIKMTRNYLANRSIITRCCILVDSTRGLCHGDRSLMRYLNRMSVPWLIIMTKGDLLSPEELAASITLVRQEIVERGLVSVKAAVLKDNESEWEDGDGDVIEKELEKQKMKEEEVVKGNKKKSKKSGDITAATGVAVASLSQNDTTSVDELTDLELDPTGLTYDDEDSYLEAVPQPEPSVSGGKEKKKKTTESTTTKGIMSDEASADAVVKVEKVPLEDREGVTILPVSANTGAGVQALWKKLCSLVGEDSKPGGMYDVKEHKRADFQRKRLRIDRMLAMAKAHNITMVKKKSPVIRK